MNPIQGKCHCGNIAFEFEHPEFDPDSTNRLPVRACSCSFCVKHGGVYTSHPKGTLNAQIHDMSEIQRYEFGTGTAHFYICKQCGVFSFVTSEIDGQLYAVVNVNTFENVDRDKLEQRIADFEGEGTGDRLGRRKRTWIGTVEVRV